MGKNAPRRLLTIRATEAVHRQWRELLLIRAGLHQMFPAKLPKLRADRVLSRMASRERDRLEKWAREQGVDWGSSLAVWLTPPENAEPPPFTGPPPSIPRLLD
jgi:hypothetical protein